MHLGKFNITGPTTTTTTTTATTRAFWRRQAAQNSRVQHVVLGTMNLANIMTPVKKLSMYSYSRTRHLLPYLVYFTYKL